MYRRKQTAPMEFVVGVHVRCNTELTKKQVESMPLTQVVGLVRALHKELIRVRTIPHTKKLNELYDEIDSLKQQVQELEQQRDFLQSDNEFLRNQL